MNHKAKETLELLDNIKDKIESIANDFDADRICNSMLDPIIKHLKEAEEECWGILYGMEYEYLEYD